MLINSDAHGNPVSAWTGLFHFPRFSSNPAMHAVNQTLAGGAHPQDDCAPACVLSRLLDDGRSLPMRQLEHLCGTNGSGTLIQRDPATGRPGLLDGLLALGYKAHVESMTRPTPSRLMNPAWGGFVSQAACGPYLAAWADVSVIIDTPGTWEQPPPQPTPEESEDMITVTRADGITRDIFDVDPSGVGWHTVIVDNGNPSIAFNEPIPGRWSAFQRAFWSADGQTLSVIGRGWQDGAGGQTYYDYWRIPGGWKGPVKQP